MLKGEIGHEILLRQPRYPEVETEIVGDDTEIDGDRQRSTEIDGDKLGRSEDAENLRQPTSVVIIAQM